MLLPQRTDAGTGWVKFLASLPIIGPGRAQSSVSSTPLRLQPCGCLEVSGWTLCLFTVGRKGASYLCRSRLLLCHWLFEDQVTHSASLLQTVTHTEKESVIILQVDLFAIKNCFWTSYHSCTQVLPYAQVTPEPQIAHVPRALD